MAGLAVDNIPETTTSAQVSAVEDLARSVATVTVHDNASQPSILQQHENDTAALCPIRIYTRRQLLLLHNSSLVQLPPNMPVLKDWFGSDNEQNLSKKDLEPIAPNTGRDRRSRRDAEESPMGNFKHQRPNDDRGLRHLPEKFVPPTQRETALHLNSSSSNKSGAQAQVPATASRRADAREAAKKKGGEASDDWRRGAESRSTREDRAEPSRRDRDERDRPRSRVRDSSRHRGDPSVSRRDRDREDKDRIRGEREREDSRRDRDADREVEFDDPRRWRDDGKRDERMAARRGDRYPDQYRDKERVRDKDSTWDSTTDRRWMSVEERDARPKRLPGREKRNGPIADDTKEREERRDRERDREKEPAWMDTYIPNPSSGHILGSKGVDGELDGIQAWKKGLKEKDMKATIKETNGVESRPLIPNDQLDEIQLFRLLMKREEEKKKSDNADPPPPLVGASPLAVKAAPNLPNLQTPQSIKTSEDDATSAVQGTAEQSTHLDMKTSPLPQLEIISPSARKTPHPIVDYKESSDPTQNPTASLELSTGGLKAPLSPQVVRSHAPQETNVPDMERTPSALPPQFNPPQGSRLLAFARTSSAAARPQAAVVSKPPNGSFQTTGISMLEPNLQQGLPKSDAVRSLQGFSPFEEQTRPSFIFEEPGKFAGSSTGSHQELREHVPFTPVAEHGSFQDVSSDNGVGLSTSKGSRFAKFFDGKGRDGAISVAKPQGPIGFPSSSPGPGPGQRQEHFNAAMGGLTDHRAMDDIYAMLNNSSQNQRGGTGNIPSTPPSHVPLAQQAQHNLNLFQQQQVYHQNQQQIHNNRLEPLYESRLDDRNFMPDGMVPGLRSAPPPRTRENAGYPDVSDDSLHLNHHHQRLPQQHRPVDQMYSGSMYSQQTGRNNAFPLQPPHYRGGASPISSQPPSLQNTQQRLPPGLANLGGRPPLEPSQYLGMPGMPTTGLHGGLHLNGSSQPPYNSFTAGSNMSYVGGPQGRAPHQQLNPVVHQAMGGPGHQSHIDLRSASSNQVLGMSGVGLGGMRGLGGGFSGHQGQPTQGQGPLLAMRPQQQQQQQQQLPPHLMSHLLPPHLQQQGPQGPNGSQPTHDLMALLMGGTHRE
ncbi:hypothetical protein L208DRAFT_1409088 [Tricholoma matsutake]|nr:hypothetical protein L208DRAFT_1409088 [Tricholoma matsutake 945]